MVLIGKYFLLQRSSCEKKKHEKYKVKKKDVKNISQVWQN